MPRCQKRLALEVHYKRPSGAIDVGNAIVLCDQCGQRHLLNGRSASPAPAFPDEVKRLALVVAGHRCECVSDECH